MAERLVPPLPEPEPASSAVSTRFGSQQLDLVAMPPARLVQPHATYVVVQVQKDRIYRVPPPENAYLAERYRTDRAGGGKSGGSSTCSPSVLRAAGVVVAAALLLGAVVVLSTVVLRPGAPSFSINRLSVHNDSHMDYDIFLTAINRNKLTALWYNKESGSTAKLLHEGTTLAKGGVGEPADGGEDATDFNAVLHGSPPHDDGRNPKSVEKALGASKHALTLELSAEVPVQVHVGALGFGRKRLTVACSITTAGLIPRKDVHILSQKCRSSFEN